jgi:hemerythrin-like metal-binding protein
MRRPAFFVWSDAFALGLPAVDAEHRSCFEAMSRCAAALASDATAADLDERLLALVACAGAHFTSEEAALLQAGYPELPAQRAEHLRFLRALERLRVLPRTELPAALPLVRDWLLEHVTCSDRYYLAWIGRERSQHPG